MQPGFRRLCFLLHHGCRNPQLLGGFRNRKGTEVPQLDDITVSGIKVSLGASKRASVERFKRGQLVDAQDLEPLSSLSSAADPVGALALFDSLWAFFDPVGALASFEPSRCCRR